MLKKVRLLTRPTLAATSSARPESAKTASSPRDAFYPERGPSNSLYLPLGEWPRLPSTARIERYTCSLQACSFFLQGWGLIDLLLRASNEGLLRPRVARAQKIIRLHPLLCSASKEGTWPLPAHPSEAARCASTGIVPATPLLFSASCYTIPCLSKSCKCTTPTIRLALSATTSVVME
jgi:hypothetical protein